MVVAVLTRVAWCRFTALYASSAACAALFARDRIGGRGQTVTVDMLHVCMHHTSLDLHNNTLWKGHAALPPFPEFSAIYSRFLFTCKDGDQIAAVPISDAEAQAFAKAYEEELGGELCRQIMPRKKGEQSGGELGTLAKRIARIDDFVRICERTFLKIDSDDAVKRGPSWNTAAADWHARARRFQRRGGALPGVSADSMRPATGQAADFPVRKLNTVNGVFTDPQIVHAR